MKDLQKKVEDYHEKRGLLKSGQNVNYIGLRESVEVRIGEFKRVHSFRFGISAGEEYELRPGYVLVNANTNRLEVLITPHFSEDIYEE